MNKAWGAISIGIVVFFTVGLALWALKPPSDYWQPVLSKQTGVLSALRDATNALDHASATPPPAHKVLLPITTHVLENAGKNAGDDGELLWLVEDNSLALVSVRIDIAGMGSAYDTPAQQGRASMAATLLMEGAGELDEAAFAAALEMIGARVQVSAGRDTLSIALDVPVQYREQAMDLVQLMLQSPRFAPDRVEHVRRQMLASLRLEQQSAAAIASKVLNSTYYGTHPYALAGDGSEQTLARINRNALVDWWGGLARERATISIAGDVTPEDAVAYANSLLAAMPTQKEAVTTLPPVVPAQSSSTHIAMDIPQTQISMALPGIARDDERYYAATLMMHILGGSGLSSRMDGVLRKKHGLTYGSSFSLVAYPEHGLIMGGFATRAEQVAKARQLMQAEFVRMATTPVTAQELQSAKDYLIGTFALSLDGIRNKANMLQLLRTLRLPVEYVNHRAAYLSAVTVEQVQEIATTLLEGASPVVVSVGRADMAGTQHSTPSN